MFFVGEIVKPSGKGRTATWEGMVGTVVRVEGTSVFVQWHNVAVEDEMGVEELVATGPTVVAMVEAADLWNGDDRADRWWRDRPRLWRVLGQREMRSRIVVGRQISTQDAGQSGFIHDDYVMEALATDGADETLRVPVLPR